MCILSGKTTLGWLTVIQGGKQWWCWPWIVGVGMTLQGLSIFCWIFIDRSPSPPPVVAEAPTHMHKHRQWTPSCSPMRCHLDVIRYANRHIYHTCSHTLAPTHALNSIIHAGCFWNCSSTRDTQQIDVGGIRCPVPSSPHFSPNRYKLGMKSLAPCQLQSGTCRIWLLPKAREYNTCSSCHCCLESMISRIANSTQHTEY